MFLSEQSDKKFQKIFFGQNFVNRALYEEVSAKVWRVPPREEKQTKGLLLKASSKRK